MKTGPSREMLGGPLVGVAIFVVIAILLGWGLISLFNGMLDQASHDVTDQAVNHGFVAGGAYLTKKPMLLGYTSDGRLVLFPDREDLPRSAPNWRVAPTVAGYREHPEQYPDLLGVVEAGTALRIDQVIEDADNPQTRLLIQCKVLTGPYAVQTPLGLHLETRSTDEETNRPRYDPRPELLTPAKPVGGEQPLQSTETPAPPPDAE